VWRQFANTGTVAQLSGTLSVVKADGSVRILSQKSEVSAAYRQHPERQLCADQIHRWRFDHAQAEYQRENPAVPVQAGSAERGQFCFGLVKAACGGHRSGGKRGDQDAYSLGTATATIGIRAPATARTTA